MLFRSIATDALVLGQRAGGSLSGAGGTVGVAATVGETVAVGEGVAVGEAVAVEDAKTGGDATVVGDATKADVRGDAPASNAPTSHTELTGRL